MRSPRSFHSLFVLLTALAVASPALAGDKKFNVCLDGSEIRTLLEYGGMEIKAKCFFTAIPSFEYEPEIYFKSNLSQTQTTMGRQLAPFETLVFNYQGTHCGSDSGREAMISDSGHYLSVDGEGLIMCINVGSCACTLSGIIQKERIKLK